MFGSGRFSTGSNASFAPLRSSLMRSGHLACRFRCANPVGAPNERRRVWYSTDEFIAPGKISVLAVFRGSSGDGGVLVDPLGFAFTGAGLAWDAGSAEDCRRRDH
jgi:hypothetical protein